EEIQDQKRHEYRSFHSTHFLLPSRALPRRRTLTPPPSDIRSSGPRSPKAAERSKYTICLARAFGISCSLTSCLASSMLNSCNSAMERLKVVPMNRSAAVCEVRV